MTSKGRKILGVVILCAGLGVLGFAAFLWSEKVALEGTIVAMEQDPGFRLKRAFGSQDAVAMSQVMYAANGAAAKYTPVAAGVGVALLIAGLVLLLRQGSPNAGGGAPVFSAGFDASQLIPPGTPIGPSSRDFCTKCGLKLEPDDRFCGKCGSPH